MNIKRISDLNIEDIIPKELMLSSITDEVKNKDVILRYLKKFDDCAFTSQPVYDVVTGEMVSDADNGKTDGVYVWYQSEIYYFEKYNIKLKNDFIQYLETHGLL